MRIEKKIIAIVIFVLFMVLVFQTYIILETKQDIQTLRTETQKTNKRVKIIHEYYARPIYWKLVEIEHTLDKY